MGCAGSKTNKELRADLEASGEAVDVITFGLISGGCQFNGLESKGAGQWKGNGVLALTDKRVVFRSFSTAPSVEFQNAAILSVEQTNAFPGGVTATGCLKIRFRSGEGEEDALYVTPTLGTHGNWVQRLEAQKSG